MTRPSGLWGIALLPLLSACSPIPDSIPRVPGEISDEDDLRRLWLPASPDNAVAAYFLVLALSTSANEDCPTEEDNDDETIYKGGGCTDTSDRIWLGQAIESDEDGETVVDFIDFGIDDGTLYWTLNGRLSWELVDGGNVELFSSLAIDYEDEEDGFEAWQRINLLIDWNSGDYRLGSMVGEVGVQGWGLADITISEEVYLGRALTCPYPSGGELQITGENAIVVDFEEHELAVCGDCPQWTVDGTDQPFCGPLHEISVKEEEEEE